jgi:hypothetical protein
MIPDPQIAMRVTSSKVNLPMKLDSSPTSPRRCPKRNLELTLSALDFVAKGKNWIMFRILMDKGCCFCGNIEVLFCDPCSIRFVKNGLYNVSGAMSDTRASNVYSMISLKPGVNSPPVTQSLLSTLRHKFLVIPEPPLLLAG